MILSLFWYLVVYKFVDWFLNLALRLFDLWEILAVVILFDLRLNRGDLFAFIILDASSALVK